MIKTNHSSQFLTPRVQKLFILLGFASYLLQAVLLVVIAIQFYRHGLRLSQFSLMVGEAIVLPLILAGIGFVLSPRATTRLLCITKAVVVATVGMAILSLLTQVFIRYVQVFLPYGASQWYSPWQQLLPAVATIATVLFAALFLRHTKIVTLSTARVTVSVVVLAAYSVSALLTLHDMMHYYSMLVFHGALPSRGYYLIAAVVFLAAVTANYFLVSDKRQPTADRLYVSTLYVMLAYFVMTIMSGVYTLIYRLNIAPATEIDSGVFMLAGLIVYGAFIVVGRKRLVTP